MGQAIIHRGGDHCASMVSPILVLVDMVVPKNTTDVPMMTTLFTCGNAADVQD
jgi:hypothetical protein